MPRDLLRRYPLLALLNPRQLDAWLAGGQEAAFATGETVFQQGSAGAWAYLVLEGRVRMLRQSATVPERSLGAFTPGELFGEYALVPPHTNTATCRAAEPARLLRMPLLALRRVFAAQAEIQSNLKNWLRLHALVCCLRGQTFLGFLSAPSGLGLLERLTPMTFQAARTIQANGLAADCWYVIESGQVALHPPADDSSSPPRELGPGDCFGEGALLGRPGLPVAVALTETRCLGLPRSAFARPPDAAPDASLQTFGRPPAGCQPAYPWVGQQEAADCGVAALSMIARHHGVDVPVERLRQQVGVGERGASLMALQRAAEALGLPGQAVRVSTDQLGQVGLPFLAHLRDGHYVAVYELGPSGVVVGDPAAGMVRWSLPLFAQACSGRLLLVRRPAPVGR